jgi:hypothetical protein
MGNGSHAAAFSTPTVPQTLDLNVCLQPEFYFFQPLQENLG